MAIIPKTGIALGGTAPAMTLMSGAMLAFDEAGVDFEVISTTGVGGLIGMLYLAPNGTTRQKALRALPNLFVSDFLYRFCPVNFKVFNKYGPLATKFWQLRKALPQIPVEPDESSPFKRFVNDWIQLWATALTPPSYETASKGLMSHVPLIEELVDFKALQASPTRFYLNAFSLWKRRLRFFDNKTAVDMIDADRYNGAQAMLMLFEPVRIQGDLLTTGATRDPTGLQAVWIHERATLDRVITLDPVVDSAWRMPTNAYDAFQLMLMNPIAAMQQLMLGFYARTEEAVNNAGGHLPRLDRIPISIKDSYYPKMWEWTHDNAMKLQDIGYQAAKPVAAALLRNDLAALAELRYSQFVATHDSQVRARQFLRLYQPMLDHIDHFLILPAAARPYSRRVRQ